MNRTQRFLRLVFFSTLPFVFLVFPQASPSQARTTAFSAGLPIPEIRSVRTRLERVEGTFPPHATFQKIMQEMGFESLLLHRLIQQVNPVYNLNRVLAGHGFVLERGSDGTLKTLKYHINDEEYLWVEDGPDGFRAWRRKYRFDTVVEQFYGVIRESLWATVTSGGETDPLVHALTQILQWDIDFTAIQPEDSLRVIFEKKYLDGEFVKYGAILALSFDASGRSFSAFRFRDPEDGKNKYYDREGVPVRKALLKVPFHFDPRITSRFSHSRYHPILKKRRPHLGVDYGAPRGTPVLAAGAGRVIFAGTNGGYGKLVKIRHLNGFVTAYAHLSRIDVRRGETVDQGEQIGRVGATGLATGPHLDYRVQDQSGRYLDPRRVSALPSDKPLDRRHWNGFKKVRDRFNQQLASLPDASLKAAAVSPAD